MLQNSFRTSSSKYFSNEIFHLQGKRNGSFTNEWTCKAAADLSTNSSTSFRPSWTCSAHSWIFQKMLAASWVQLNAQLRRWMGRHLVWRHRCTCSFHYCFACAIKVYQKGKRKRVLCKHQVQWTFNRVKFFLFFFFFFQSWSSFIGWYSIDEDDTHTRDRKFADWHKGNGNRVTHAPVHTFQWKCACVVKFKCLQFSRGCVNVALSASGHWLSWKFLNFSFIKTHRQRSTSSAVSHYFIAALGRLQLPGNRMNEN